MSKPLALAEVFPPGMFLEEELEARGWSQADLAAILGRPTQVVNEIVRAKKAITPETSVELGAALGVSRDFFLKLENAYQMHRAVREAKGIEQRAKVYAKVPVRDLIKRGWLPAIDDPGQLEQGVCKFLGIARIDDDPKFRFVARKSDGYGSYSPGQLAWFSRCRQLALSRSTKRKFSLKALVKLAQTLPLDLAAPAYLSELPAFLSDVGVRLVLLDPLPGTKIDGAAFWLNKQKPVVALSLRFDRIDHFWFTLMHELAHLVHDGPEHDGIDIDLFGEADSQAAKPEHEQRADEQASQWLISSSVLEDFIDSVQRKYFSHAKIVEFALEVGVHPGIVVGQLQHRKLIGYSHSRKFLAKVKEWLPMDA